MIPGEASLVYCNPETNTTIGYRLVMYVTAYSKNPPEKMLL
jgi:hypothetical protein